jgi:hypothetical protein
VTDPRLVSIAVLATLFACADDDGGDGRVTEVTETTAVAAPELRAELLAMMEEDQAEMSGQVATDNYRQRTDRLAEILDEHGWPRADLVGEDGSTAAWVIAQHADLDPELQQRALELLRAAAQEGQASRGDLAYLEDRVAVAAGQDQPYGTQISCETSGTVVAAAPIADEANVDERRADAGLPRSTRTTPRSPRCVPATAEEQLEPGMPPMWFLGSVAG